MSAARGSCRQHACTHTPASSVASQPRRVESSVAEKNGPRNVTTKQHSHSRIRHNLGRMQTNAAEFFLVPSDASCPKDKMRCCSRCFVLISSFFGKIEILSSTKRSTTPLRLPTSDRPHIYLMPPWSSAPTPSPISLWSFRNRDQTLHQYLTCAPNRHHDALDRDNTGSSGSSHLPAIATTITSPLAHIHHRQSQAVAHIPSPSMSRAENDDDVP